LICNWWIGEVKEEGGFLYASAPPSSIKNIYRNSVNVRDSVYSVKEKVFETVLLE